MSQITNIESTKPQAAKYLSKYSFMRHSYLEEYQPDLYAELLRAGELKSHCLGVQQMAESRLKSMMAQLVQVKPPPNRNTNGLAWAAHMSMLKRSAEEIVFSELIYE